MPAESYARQTGPRLWRLLRPTPAPASVLGLMAVLGPVASLTATAGLGVGCKDDTAGLHVDRITNYSIAPLQETLRLQTIRGRLRPGPWRRQASASLEAYLRLLADHGPTSTRAMFPRDLQRAAFYLNAHTAAVLDSWRLKATDPDAGAELTPAELTQRRFRVDGQMESIASLAERALAEGLPMTLLALGRGTAASPPLPPAFQQADPRPALQAHVVRVLTEPRAFQEQASGELATFPAVLDAVPERLSLYTFLDRELPMHDRRRLAVLRAAQAGRIVPMPPGNAPAWAP